MRRQFYHTVVLAVSTLAVFQNAVAQNTAPYWSLAGNANATSTSKLGTTNGTSLRIYSGNVQRMLVGSTTGNVSIGATTLDARLTVNAAPGTNLFLGQLNGTTRLRAASNGGLAVGSGSTPPANGLYVSGNVGIGTSTPANKLSIAGGGPYTTAARINNGGLRVTNEWSTGDSSVGIYAEGGIGVSGSGMTGIYGSGMTGVFGTGYMGVYGEGSSSGAGVSGYSSEGAGVYGSSGDQAGVQGESFDGYGGDFRSEHSWGLRASTTSGFYAGVFYGNVFTSGTYYPSDKNLKQNVQEFGDAMNLINKLKPRYYEYKTDEKYAFLKLATGRHYGLMAQDVEEVFPDLVSTSAQEVMKPKAYSKTPRSPHTAQPQAATEKPETLSLKAVNYTELIPILVKGMQEQSELIQQQQLQIDELKSQVSRLSGTNTRISAVGGLGQNTPNPVSNTTRIAYSIPSTAGRAQLVLTDIIGKTVKATNLIAGSSAVTLTTTGLSNGIYHYALIVDGKIVDSKKMEVLRNK